MSDTITVADAPTRQPRQAAERVLTSPEPSVAVEAAEPATGPTPEEALAETQAALREKDAQIARERDGRTRAEREAQRANAGRATDRSAAVAGALEAAKSAKSAAAQAKKAAREAGDIDAEIAADEALHAAVFRENSAAAELAGLKNGEPTSAAGETRPATGGNGYSSAAQAWIDAHPRFNSDPAYKAAVLAAHGSAVADGVAPDSRAYFRELDRVAGALDKPNGDTERNNPMPQERGGFGGAPPARGGDGGRGNGAGTVQTRLGPVQVSEGRDGKIQVKVPPALMADFQEGAKICGMDLGKYIYDQVEIARQESAGGNAGLTMVEGATYR